jgi:hypothetical protein
VKRRKGLLDEEKFLPPLPEQLPRGVSSLPGYGQTSPVAQGLLGFTGRNPTYSVMDPQAQEMSDAYRLGEQASVASQLYGSVLPFAAASTMASAQRAGSLLSPLTVFHGSPHKFSKFDASKIGTGEGAQVYGHGIYLAENPAVAKQYQKNLSGVNTKNANEFQQFADLVYKEYPDTRPVIGGIEYPTTKEIIDGIKTGLIKKGDMSPELYNLGKKFINEGNFYTADLPDEEIAKMLDWDKPLSQQSRAIQKFALENSKPLAKLVKFQQANKLNENPPKSIYDLSGGELMRELGSPQEVAQKLRDSGIPGVRYLDQGSRGANKGTSNFVVFPGEESKVRIMEINGKPVVIDEEELMRSGLLGQ